MVGRPVGNVRLGRRFTDAEQKDSAFILSCAKLRELPMGAWAAKMRAWKLLNLHRD